MRVGDPLKLTFFKNTYYSNELKSGEKVKETGEDLGSIEFGEKYFRKVLKDIEKITKETQGNFTEVFEQFNGFQTSIYTYFQDPSTTSSVSALTSYDNMRQKINNSFTSAGIEKQIKESHVNQIFDHLIESVIKKMLIK